MLSVVSGMSWAGEREASWSTLCRDTVVASVDVIHKLTDQTLCVLEHVQKCPGCTMQGCASAIAAIDAPLMLACC